MNTPKHIFLAGLKNAHAMERQAQEMLERQVERLTDYPELRSKLRDHLSETKQQIERIDDILFQCGSAPSSMKNLSLIIGATVTAMGHSMADDAVLKITFSNSALVAYEIAAYRSLIAMADAASVGAKTVLQESLHEQERMAAWLEEHVEQITQQYLTREQKAA